MCVTSYTLTIRGTLIHVVKYLNLKILNCLWKSNILGATVNTFTFCSNHSG